MKNFTTRRMFKKLALSAWCLALSLSPCYATEDLTQIESYLNNIKNITADFTQQSESGTVAGKFYLARNSETAGKMRVEYLAEPKIVIVVNGAVLSYFDVELDEISHLSTNTTPASFLTRPNISFAAKDIEVTKVEKEPNQISISLVKKNRKDAGEFTLIFDLNPLRFIKMKVKNDLEQIVTVTLSNIDFKSAIPNKSFVISRKK
jgi:outer membrane lipoprotein-sorting protein